MSRDTIILIALGVLAFASVLASIGAWVLLWRDRARRRFGGDDRPSEPPPRRGGRHRARG